MDTQVGRDGHTRASMQLKLASWDCPENDRKNLSGGRVVNSRDGTNYLKTLLKSSGVGSNKTIKVNRLVDKMFVSLLRSDYN